MKSVAQNADRIQLLCNSFIAKYMKSVAQNADRIQLLCNSFIASICRSTTVFYGYVSVSCQAPTHTIGIRCDFKRFKTRQKTED